VWNIEKIGKSNGWGNKKNYRLYLNEENLDMHRKKKQKVKIYKKQTTQIRQIAEIIKYRILHVRGVS